MGVLEGDLTWPHWVPKTQWRALTIIRLIGEPAVLGILVDVVGVALGTLLGPEVLVGPGTVLTVADLVLEQGS